MIDSYITNSSVIRVLSKVELYSGSTLVTTCTCSDRLKDFTVERIGNNNKFFGYGVFHKLTVNLIDLERELEITEDNSFKVYLTYSDHFINPYPTFYVAKATRDETTNTITVEAYDNFVLATDYPVSNVAAPYTLREFANAAVSLLGVSDVVCGKNLWDNNSFETNTTEDYLTRTETGFIFNRNGSTRGFVVYYSVPVKAGETYTFSIEQSGGARLYIYSDAPYGNELIFTSASFATYTFEEDINAVFAVIIDTTVLSLDVSNIQVEKSAARTLYEPYLSAFDTYYEQGGNFEGTESYKEALNAIAEVTQTIYYINNENKLIFKRLDTANDPVLTIVKNDYFELQSGSTISLGCISSVSELGDNAYIGDPAEGTQYVRNNPFWENNENLDVLLENALSAVLGMEITQFSCRWVGNFHLEVGDKIAIITKDDSELTTYVINDRIDFNGALSENTYWTYEAENEEVGNPTNLGEALKQTFATVDKVNKQITLVVSETEANKESISSLQQTANDITASVNSIEQTEKDHYEKLTKEVQTKVTSDQVTTLISRELSNGVDSVTTTTGFTFDYSGLTISKSDSKVSTNIDNEGMSVFSGSIIKDEETNEILNKEDAVLTANNEGVKAVNLYATTYLIIGTNSRLENFERDGEPRTACFWIRKEEV